MCKLIKKSCWKVYWLVIVKILQNVQMKKTFQVLVCYFFFFFVEWRLYHFNLKCWSDSSILNFWLTLWCHFYSLSIAQRKSVLCDKRRQRESDLITVARVVALVMWGKHHKSIQLINWKLIKHKGFSYFM